MPSQRLSPAELPQVLPRPVCSLVGFLGALGGKMPPLEPFDEVPEFLGP